MIQIGPFVFDHSFYDRRRDVLYLSKGEPQEAADAYVTPQGHVIRYDAAHDVIGVTIVNAKWLIDRGEDVSVPFPAEISAEDLSPALALVP